MASSPATGSPSPSVGALVSASAAATVSTVTSFEPFPSGTSYFFVEKLGDGGHGVPGPVALPGLIAIDYRVAGTCEFSIELVTDPPTAGLPALTMRVAGGLASGTLHVSIAPGTYTVHLSESVGCTYTVNVRDG